jgi:FtsZ-binding cell division protein ZapB
VVLFDKITILDLEMREMKEDKTILALEMREMKEDKVGMCL